MVDLLIEIPGGKPTKRKQFFHERGAYLENTIIKFVLPKSSTNQPPSDGVYLKINVSFKLYHKPKALAESKHLG